MTLCYPPTAIWPDPSVLPPDPVDPDNPTPEEQLAEQQIEVALGLAWTTLQVLTAYQLAICPISVRPCRKQCAFGTYFIAPVFGGPMTAPFWPSVSNGVWTNIWCGHSGECGCTRIREVKLIGPVGGIESVMIDGEVIDPSAYRVDDGHKLVRQDGQEWPVCQDMNAPAGEDNTFVITYYHGAVDDITVRWAAGILADEYLKAVLGDDDCRLPAGTTNVVRQGVSFELQTDLFENGITGIREVDAVIRRFNPYIQRMPSSIYSLDRKGPRVTTIDS